MKLLKQTFLCFGALTLITGLLYPLVVTAVSMLFWEHERNGSQIVLNGKVVGSDLIGQRFADDRYLWGRLSATSPVPYNGAASSGSNLAPSNPLLREQAQAALTRYEHTGGETPVDLVTASASGLDPHISLAAANFQVRRIAHARGVPEDEVRTIISGNTTRRFLRIFGEPVVHVLRVNLALDTAEK